jgi:hypothetical protein
MTVTEDGVGLSNGRSISHRLTPPTTVTKSPTAMSRSGFLHRFFRLASGVTVNLPFFPLHIIEG